MKLLTRMKRGVLSFALGIALVFTGFSHDSALASGTAYRDISQAHYASAAIAKLTELGLFQPDSDGDFLPDHAVTRGETAAVIGQALKLPEPASRVGFEDVPADHPYASAIYALKEKGIFQGSGGLFNPDALLTREQLASVLVRVFQWKDNGIQVWFKDEASLSASHAQDVFRIKQQMVTDQEEFLPAEKVTKAQLAVFIYRSMELDLQEEGLIPLEDFFRKPAQAGFQMSPDGQYLAFLQPADNRMNLFVKKIGGQEVVQVTHATERDIMGYIWEGSSKLVYATDKGGDENFHLYSVGIDGKEDKDLTPFENTRAMLLDPLEDNEQEMLVMLNKRDPRIFDVYRLNVQTGELKLSAENPGYITGWMTDHQGKIRIAISSDGNNSNVLYRASEDQPFEPLLATDYHDTFSPIVFDADNKHFYALSNENRDKLAVVKFDPVSKRVEETVFEHPEVDAAYFMYSAKSRKAIAAVYETDKIHMQFFDKNVERLYSILKQKTDGKEVSVQDVSKDGSTVLFRTYSDKTLGAYYFYDIKKNKVEKLADLTPWLDESKMAEMKPISYKSQDGLTIHGYLTLPKGKDPKNLPVVVNPHGGPWARDSWGFNPEVQFLANRGYAVLQMNFRGSTGYGKEFWGLGKKQWGKKMQQDITDGVHWLIEQGIADPDRVAIYGASYGGYATLAGLAFTPDLYAAGVDYVGPSNLFTLLNSLPPYWESERQKMYELIGDPVKDKALLEEISPLFHADKIKAPLFIAQGANDPRVKQAESDQMVQALRSRGVDVPYMVKANEGHGFYNTENRFDFYRILEKFLHRHLKN